jgi:hypothetical protein
MRKRFFPTILALVCFLLLFLYANHYETEGSP